MRRAQYDRLSQQQLGFLFILLNEALLIRSLRQGTLLMDPAVLGAQPSDPYYRLGPPELL